MPRKGNKVVKRKIAPDPNYGSVIVAKFTNKLMQRGQKATAERIMYNALSLASEQAKESPVDVLEKAIKNVTPSVMVRSRRVGGATYQVPLEVEEERGRALAIKWLIISARSHGGRSMTEKLASVLVEAIQGQGAAIKKRDDVHKMAEANRAFMHYRW